MEYVANKVVGNGVCGSSKCNYLQCITDMQCMSIRKLLSGVEKSVNNR